MKSIDELIIPEDLRYAEDHEWVKVAGDKVRVGIDDYAQDQLQAIVYVELPEVGANFQKGEPFGVVESVKAVVDCYMPVGGEIIAVNTALVDSPQLVNESPYNEGWMIDVKATDLSEMDTLYTSESIKEAVLKRMEEEEDT
ncbi:MAG: glycine cleavage system protein H [Candidatus Altiarchaeales archaeon WOR_SM1_79]|nr:MAG: glycine cleavage system protein H [Candidatus Altiarchaeales archaeon WOR_SM1_79]